MILDPYLLEDGQPARMLFLKIPYASIQKEWEKSSEQNTQVITLDITLKKNCINVLLSRPDWDYIGIAPRLENICSNLLMLMESCSLVKDRKHVNWFKISYTLEPTRFQSIQFKDNGTWLSDPVLKTLSLEEFPFNVEQLKDLGTGG